MSGSTKIPAHLSTRKPIPKLVDKTQPAFPIVGSLFLLKPPFSQKLSSNTLLPLPSFPYSIPYPRLNNIQSRLTTQFQPPPNSPAPPIHFHQGNPPTLLHLPRLILFLPTNHSNYLQHQYVIHIPSHHHIKSNSISAAFGTGENEPGGFLFPLIEGREEGVRRKEEGEKKKSCVRESWQAG